MIYLRHNGLTNMTMSLADDIRDSAESLIYIINNPDDNVIDDIKGTIDDLVFLKSQLKQSDADSF